MQQSADLAVVGGGAIGLACAWRCAQAGLRVVVLDDRPARGATWAAAGMLAPVTELHAGEEELLRLNLASNERWPDFAAAVAEAAGTDIGHRISGTLVVARDRDDAAVLDDLHALQVRLGLEAKRLGARATRALEPGLSPRISGGIAVAGDNQVDNRALVEALLVACRRAGVEVRESRVTGLRRVGDRVTGVVTQDGDELASGRVLLAAGAASGAIEGLPRGAVPTRPVKGQLLHLRRPAGDPLTIAERNIRGVDVYIVPRADGRVVVGATAEERGWDRSVTAGAVLHLLRAAWELLPGLAEYELTETIAGLRPGSPDNRPLIGWGPLEGLVVATGHYRNGVLLTPLTSEAIAALLTDRTPPVDLGPFDPRRFESSAVRSP